MKVIIMSEENHSFLGVAKDYKSAIKYLCKTGWLDENFEFCEYKEGWKYSTILDRLGLNWFNIICSWTIEKFNEYFEPTFALREEEVWEDEEDD